MPVGVIGGTGLRRLADGWDEHVVQTPWGDVTLSEGDLQGARVVFLPRHGAGHDVPPHRLPHRAHMAAFARHGVDAVLAVNNTGSLRAQVPIGAAVVPDDLVDLTGRVWTIYEDEVVHVEFSAPYCPHMRTALLAGLETTAWPEVRDSGVYVQSTGPRLETRAEVQELARLGDVVGMSGAPEATLAREAGICYASLCFVANHAAGVTPERASAQEIEAALAAAKDNIGASLAAAVARVPVTRECGCRDAPAAGRLS